MRIRQGLPAAVVVAAALTLPAAASAAPSPGLLAPTGCAMSHCDQGISGATDTPPPAGPVSTLWSDRTAFGSGFGLGCSSNTRLAVCSYASSLFKRTSLRAYRPDGSQAWSSSLLNTTAQYSAPVVGEDGSTIAADNTRAVRIAADGRVLWNTRTPGGTPISPNLTDDGRVVLATLGGPLSVLDSDTGAVLTSLRLNATVDVDGQSRTGYFDTFNTPAVRGNRVYISTQFRDDGGVIRPFGRLYAVDVTGSGAGTRLDPAWSVDFAAPSGASPLVVTRGGEPTIVFDGRGTTAGRTDAPNFMGVRDEGSSGRLLWSRTIAQGAQSAATADPRGGAWVFAPFTSNLQRLDTDTGAVLQTINVDPLVNQPGVHGPSSTMNITGPADRPVMLLSATPPSFASSYLLAIDLVSGQARWTQRIDDRLGLFGVSYGQFPVVTRADGSPSVVFTTYGGGTRAVG